MKGRESGMPDESYWDSFFDPTCIIERLDCTGKCGDVVEFGCGYGTFTIPTAKAISGRVFALVIEPGMVEATLQKAAEADLSNVVGIVRDFVGAGTGLPNEHAGRAMLFNILHIENPLGLLQEAYRVLVPGGEVGIIHWRSDISTPRGPSMPIRPTAEQCQAWSEQVGFEFVRKEPLFCCSWHWGLLMRRPLPFHAHNKDDPAAKQLPRINERTTTRAASTMQSAAATTLRALHFLNVADVSRHSPYGAKSCCHSRQATTLAV